MADENSLREVFETQFGKITESDERYGELWERSCWQEPLPNNEAKPDFGLRYWLTDPKNTEAIYV